MSKVFVTGGCGFIGAHLVSRLLREGREVVVFDNMKRSTPASLARCEPRGRLTIVEGDIRNFAQVAVAIAGSEVVYHLAAQSNVMGAIDDPDYSVTTNVLGTFNVLRASSEAKAGRVVFTSSREVYGDPKLLPVDESQPLIAKNPYGASKIAGEAYCGTFRHTHGLDVQVVRYANVYGPGDSGRVIPLWLTAALRGEPLRVYGGKQVIDFLWVGTAVDALLLATERGLPGPVNIGSGVGTDILALARRVIEVTQSRSQVEITAAREVEVAKFVADTRVMRSLGLTPDVDPLTHLAEVAASFPR